MSFSLDWTLFNILLLWVGALPPQLDNDVENELAVSTADVLMEGTMPILQKKKKKKKKGRKVCSSCTGFNGEYLE